MKVMIGILTILATLLSGPTDGQPSILNETRKVEITYEIKDLPGLNSEGFEFSPALYKDRIVFTSDREFDLVNIGENNWKKRTRLNLFVVDVKNFGNDSLEFSEAELFNSNFQSVSHSGPISFSEDGSIAVFTQVPHKHAKEYKGKLHRPSLFYSKHIDGKWQSPVLLPFVDDAHSYGHPHVSEDGKTLYFSSNMEGGYGGDDIYKSTFDGENWTKPENLGEGVNSDKNEVFPYLRNDILYFSSNGRGSIGGLDLFMSKLIEGAFDSAERMVEPMNSTADDFGIIFKSDEIGYFSTNRENGHGKDDIYMFKVKETVTVESDFLAGEFSYRNLDSKGSNLKVMLVDENGNVIMETMTDENGQFIFKKLGSEGNYRIKIEGEDPMELVIFDLNGQKVAQLLSDNKGEFLYKLLDSGDHSSLSLMDPDDIKNGLGDINGQFVYENLPNKYASKMKVMLVDENGNVSYETFTDEFGNFNFKQLPSSGNYIVRMEELDDDLTLLIFNKDDNISAVLRRNGLGEYVYKRLDQKYNSQLSMLEVEENELFDDELAGVFGQFQHRKLNSGINKALSFELIDKNGNIVFKNVTDEKGFFRLSNLPLSESYMFRLPESDMSLDDVQLVIMNRKGKQVAILFSDRKGYFVYTPLGLSGSLTIEQMTTEHVDIAMLAKVPTIYYDKGSYVLSAKARKVLDELVQSLKDNPDVKIEINSYADSRASAEFNLKLSGKRTNSVLTYLKKKGIPESRIGGNAYGESKLLNDCGDGVDCPESLHQLNRRSEVRVY